MKLASARVRGLGLASRAWARLRLAVRGPLRSRKFNQLVLELLFLATSIDSHAQLHSAEDQLAKLDMWIFVSHRTTRVLEDSHLCP